VKPTTPGFSGMEPPSRNAGNVLERENERADSRVKPISLGVQSSALVPVMQRFREGFEEGGGGKKPGEGAKPNAAPEPQTLDAQLERLHRMMRGESEKPSDKKPADKIPGIPDKTSPTKPGDKTTGAVVVPRAGDNRSGLTSRPGTLDALTPEVLRGIKKVGEQKVEHFVTPKPIPGVPDTADPESYRVLMREGESLLKAGRFFDAEDRFVRSVAASPGDPLARAGRVHAEIGAGLYLSAAANLRALFADHPELVSTRYADSLLPTPDRAKVIIDQLQAEEKKAESSLGRESALLLAYMGYQRSDQKLIDAGLKDLEQRALPGEDGDKDRALLALVRAAWTK